MLHWLTGSTISRLLQTRRMRTQKEVHLFLIHSRERVRCIKEIQGLALGVAGQYHSLAGQVECKAEWCNAMDSTIVAMHLSLPACCSSNEGQICRKHSQNAVANLASMPLLDHALELRRHQQCALSWYARAEQLHPSCLQCPMQVGQLMVGTASHGKLHRPPLKVRHRQAQ